MAVVDELKVTLIVSRHYKRMKLDFETVEQAARHAIDVVYFNTEFPIRFGTRFTHEVDYDNT